MIKQLKHPNFYIILAVDLVLFGLSHLLAYLMRFDFLLKPTSVNNMLALMPMIIVFKALVFWFFGLYRGMWRYTSLSDLSRLFKACIFSGLCIFFSLMIVYRFKGFSRAVFILDTVLTFILCVGFRVGIRVAYQHFHSKIKTGKRFKSWFRANGKATLIIGAGDAGEKTLRELYDNPRLSLKVIGFIDDDPRKQGRTIHDIPVLGSVNDLSTVVNDCKVLEILIALPSATGEQMRHIVETCEASGIRYRTLPSLGELIDGKVSVKTLRDVSYADLLGRSQVHVDVPEIEEYIKNRCVLVTGAGGSIGSELCRQIIKFHPELLVLVDSSETNLYNIQMELKHQATFQNYITVLGNLGDFSLLDQVFKGYKPETVFHAAAYKHVPMLQRNPWQAVANNVKGTQNAMEASIVHKVKTFVLVSTDKAVRPTNVMGASKRICELLMLKYQESGTKMMGVRFGNVVGSSGSVIPLFRSQIARGGPVTVTHPDITRFFMTIPEAARLILQAGALGKGGEIFVLEMGTPVKIANLARDLIRLSGKEPDQDIEIIYSGLRSGEKLYEELITQEEGIAKTPHEKIMVLKTDRAPYGILNWKLYQRWLDEQLKRLYESADAHDTTAIVENLKEIVPEYTPQDRNVCILSADNRIAPEECPILPDAADPDNIKLRDLKAAP
jgi:FlaA1/EpsC-like NDP-sugar epimerase